MWIILLIPIFLIISLAFILIDKMLNSKGIIGDIANIIRWLFRHWWILLIIAIVLVFFGVIKI